MAGDRGGGGGLTKARELDHTPTWAVAAVCGGIILISIVLEKVLRIVGEWFKRRRKKALYEALQKIENELMILGFISLFLTFSQNYVASICIPLKVANTMWFCSKSATKAAAAANHHRRLLWYERRFLAGAPQQGCKRGYVPLISLNALHQLHIFIFFLAFFHVIYSALTMTLGRAKIRRWKEWEHEIMSEDVVFDDPTRYRLTHETSFVRGHSSEWAKTGVVFYIICFFRQFLRSVEKSDYSTLRNGFINVHLAPGMKFNFQKYIKRSLEDDFKVVVGIRPVLWAFVILFLLLDVSGWYATAVMTMFPPVVMLAVGTKLQAIIAGMAMEIEERNVVVQGMPLVEVSDHHFWFGRPHLILHLIHFILFQNAFEITYFLWIWYEFGLRSCFHHNFILILERVFLGIIVQLLCSYITLPLYALVTQMGSTMKRSVFDEHTSKALRSWHQEARRRSERRSENQNQQGNQMLNRFFSTRTFSLKPSVSFSPSTERSKSTLVRPSAL